MLKKISKEEFEKLEEKIWLEFLENATPIEIHKSVATSNWDGNSFLLNWVKDNPQTDKGTILLAYWRSAPRWNKQFANREDLLEKQGWGVDGFDFTEDMERKYVEGFYKQENIYYDPKYDFCGDDYTQDYLDKEVVREIPAVMFVPTQGDYVSAEDLDDFDEGLPLSPRDFCQELYDLYDTYTYDD